MKIIVRSYKNNSIDWVGLCETLNKYSWATQYGSWKINGNDLDWQFEGGKPQENCEWKLIPTKAVSWYEKTKEGKRSISNHSMNCGLVSSESTVYYEPTECVNVPLNEFADDVKDHLKNNDFMIMSCYPIAENTWKFGKLVFCPESKEIRIECHILPLTQDEFSF